MKAAHMLSRVTMQVEGGCWDKYMLAYIMYILSVSLLHVRIASAEHCCSLEGEVRDADACGEGRIEGVLEPLGFLEGCGCSG
jgi:hypothetical protein